MKDLNRANRQCCDLDIRNYKTNEPFLFADFCNTTTTGFTAESSYAMKKGSKALAFHNPIEGKMGLEFQCHPFKVYALLSDGIIESNAIIPVRKTIQVTEEGKVTLEELPISDTVFVYAENNFSGEVIKGTLTDKVFTATATDKLAVGSTVEVGYLIEKLNGVRRIAFNNKKIPKDYRITMETVDKDENGDLIPFLITAYKATPKRTLDLAFSSNGEPTSIKIDFDVLEDKDGNVLDMVEIQE